MFSMFQLTRILQRNKCLIAYGQYCRNNENIIFKKLFDFHTVENMSSKNQSRLFFALNNCFDWHVQFKMI